MHTACVWSEKLPFAEYSVEKEFRRHQLSALSRQPAGRKRFHSFASNLRSAFALSRFDGPYESESRAGALGAPSEAGRASIARL
jgi:hypothetical protein